MKKLIGFVAILGIVFSLAANVSYTDTAEESHPRPLVVDEI
ncbi:hypothetical protein SAMN04487936_11358 [Halobacillus dabanensis]|uniref:Phr family secreted Rap phosphatase inhibitor n=1 Tax=Halobacillus dabanensis TaxID=240302 RepID=A0A1I3Z9Z6_HALDA|nr:hypothetical protein [Halobacillus dabanensis]SFK40887.1 hypothetical protein SAMN04487936_11358 [Halobacillus dabanensis]